MAGTFRNIPMAAAGVEDGGVTDEADHKQSQTDIHAEEDQHQEDDDGYDAYECGIHEYIPLPGLESGHKRPARGAGAGRTQAGRGSRPACGSNESQIRQVTL